MAAAMCIVWYIRSRSEEICSGLTSHLLLSPRCLLQARVRTATTISGHVAIICYFHTVQNIITLGENVLFVHGTGLNK